MKKRYSTTAVLFAVIALVAAACGGTSAETTTIATAAPSAESPTSSAAPDTTTTTTAPPEPVTLNLITNWVGDSNKASALSSIVEEFEAANPDIKVLVEGVAKDNDITNRVETQFLAGEEPDIILHFGAGATANWIPDGVTIPVTELAEEWGLTDKFLPGALNEYTTDDGTLVAFPLEGFAIPLWYNTEILAQAGVDEIPVTTTDFLAAAEKIRAAGFQPLATSGADWMTPLVLSNTTADDNSTLAEGGWADNANIRRAVEEWVALRDGGAFIDNFEGVDFGVAEETFFNGEAGILYSGTWAYASLPPELEGKVVIAPQPVIPGAPFYDSPWWWAGFGANGIHISRNGGEKLGAVEKFVKFFYQGEMIARFVEQAGMVPPLKDVPVDESVLSDLFVQTIALGPDVTLLKPHPEAAIPGAVFDSWYAGAYTLPAIPGTTVDEILEFWDTLYDDNL